MKKQPSIEINIRQFLIVALGNHPYLHPLIEQLYKQREWVYYEAFQKSEFNGDVMLATYTTKSEEKMRQVAGIVQWCYEQNQFDLIYQLIKKGYKYAYQYVQQRQVVDMEEFAQSYTKRQGGLHNVSDLELFNTHIIVLYLCYRENKTLNTRNIAGEIFQQGLQDSMIQCFLDELNFSDEKIAQQREELDQLYDYYRIPKKFEPLSLGKLFELTIDQRFVDKMEKNPLREVYDARKEIFIEPYTKQMGALSGWMKALKINEMDATEHTIFTKKDVDKVFLEYLLASKENHIGEEERDLFIVSCFFMQCLALHYQEAKELYLNQAKQDYYVSMKAKEEEILKQEVKLQQKQAEWQQKLEQSKREREGVEQELREMKAKLREQDQQMKQFEDYSKEVHALRTYLYQQDQEEPIGGAEVPFETMLTLLPSKRILIFGGHPNWRQKLKEVLPSVEFIDVDEKNRDYSFLKRVDAVFINTTFFNHAFYQRIMKVINKSEVALSYLDGRSNIEQNVRDMYTFLTD